MVASAIEHLSKDTRQAYIKTMRTFKGIFGKGIFGRILLITVVALSLAVSAFAHRAMPVSGQYAGAQDTPAGIDLEAFRLPDGSLPAFCLNTGDDGSPGSLKETCDFCTLAHGIGIPHGAVIPLPALSGDCTTRAIRARIGVLSAFDTSTPGTGPPEFS